MSYLDELPEFTGKLYLYKFCDEAFDRAGEHLLSVVSGVFPQQRTHCHLVDERVFHVVVHLMRRAALVLDAVERCTVSQSINQSINDFHSGTSTQHRNRQTDRTDSKLMRE